MYLKTHIITRINVDNDWILCRGHGRARDRMAKRQFDREYLEDRLIHFTRFTVPSMQSQTNKAFQWNVLIHPKTPADLKDAFKAAAEEVDQCVFRELERDVDLRPHVRRNHWISTTNLDSDDALSRDFVEVLRKRIMRGEDPTRAYIICFVCGYHYSTRSEQGMARRASTNAYNTLVEPGHMPLTICPLVHGHMPEYFEVDEVTGPHMWLQTVHGMNIENHKVRHSKKSKDTPKEVVKERFEFNAPE